MKRFMIQHLTLVLLSITACNSSKSESESESGSIEKKNTRREVTFMNPDGLFKNPAYSQLVVTSGPMKTIYVGGQNAVDDKGQVVGKGDIKVQATQAMNNLKIALKAGGASLNNVIKWNVYIVQGQDAKAAFGALQEDLKSLPHPPIVTGVFVAGLAQPDFLVEIEAVAVVPFE